MFSNMHRQNAHNMSYTIINDQHKFLAWDPTTQINYGPHASKMAGGILSFTIALSNFILTLNLMSFEPLVTRFKPLNTFQPQC